MIIDNSDLHIHVCSLGSKSESNTYNISVSELFLVSLFTLLLIQVCENRVLAQNSQYSLMIPIYKMNTKLVIHTRVEDDSNSSNSICERKTPSLPDSQANSFILAKGGHPNT